MTNYEDGWNELMEFARNFVRDEIDSYFARKNEKIIDPAGIINFLDVEGPPVPPKAEQHENNACNEGELPETDC
jgi:hypothetical protein